MKKYLTKRVADYEVEYELNEFSSQGWEIFSVEKIDNINFTYYYNIIAYKNE